MWVLNRSYSLSAYPLHFLFFSYSDSTYLSVFITVPFYSLRVTLFNSSANLNQSYRMCFSTWFDSPFSLLIPNDFRSICATLGLVRRRFTFRLDSWHDREVEASQNGGVVWRVWACWLQCSIYVLAHDCACFKCIKSRRFGSFNASSRLSALQASTEPGSDQFMA